MAKKQDTDQHDLLRMCSTQHYSAVNLELSGICIITRRSASAHHYYQPTLVHTLDEAQQDGPYSIGGESHRPQVCWTGIEWKSTGEDDRGWKKGTLKSTINNVISWPTWWHDSCLGQVSAYGQNDTYWSVACYKSVGSRLLQPSWNFSWSMHCGQPATCIQYYWRF